MAGISAVLRGDKDVIRIMRDMRKLFESNSDVVGRIVGTEGVKGFQENIRQARGPGGAWPVLKWRKGGRPLQDTRRLYNSITYSSPLGSRLVRIGTNVIYAALHHFGGIIRATTAKLLFLPLTRKVARRYTGNARRDFPNAFVFKSRKGNLFLAEPKEGGRRKGSLELLALLRESVRIPPRPYAWFSANTWMRIRRVLEGKVQQITGGGTGWYTQGDTIV